MTFRTMPRDVVCDTYALAWAATVGSRGTSAGQCDEVSADKKVSGVEPAPECQREVCSALAELEVDETEERVINQREVVNGVEARGEREGSIATRGAIDGTDGAIRDVDSILQASNTQ